MCLDELAPISSYLLDASQDILKKKNMDALDAALDIYSADGKWVEPEHESKKSQWVQNGNGYTLNMSGYALLEKPIERKGVRNKNYPHAWVEPVFSCVTQGSISEAAWWSRKTQEGLIYWANTEKNA